MEGLSLDFLPPSPHAVICWAIHHWACNEALGVLQQGSYRGHLGQWDIPFGILCTIHPSMVLQDVPIS